MASATERKSAETNGGATTATISVENPATGELITTVPVLGPGELQALAARGRAAQVGWNEIGFEGRGRVLRRAQKWMLDNADRIIGVVVSESGKTHEATGSSPTSATRSRRSASGPRRLPGTSPTSAYRRGTTPLRPARSSSSATPRSGWLA